MPDHADNPLKDPDVYPHDRVGSSPVDGGGAAEDALLDVAGKVVGNTAAAPPKAEPPVRVPRVPLPVFKRFTGRLRTESYTEAVIFARQ
jgi:hypothetical protein